MTTIGYRHLLSVLTALLASAGLAAAQTNTWTKSNLTTGTWSQPTNWSGGNVPVTNSIDTFLEFTGNLNVTATNDLGPVELNELLLTGAGSSGKTFTIAGGTGTNNLNFVTNSAGALPTMVISRTTAGGATISIPMTVTNALTITNDDTGLTTLTISGAITNNASITVNGTTSLIMQSLMSGAGGITYDVSANSGNGVVASTYTGATTISSGSTFTVRNLALGGSSSAIGESTNDASNLILDGGVLAYDNSSSGHTTASTDRNYELTTNGGGFGTVVGTNATAGTVTFSGNMTATGTSGSQTFTLSGAGTGVIDGGAAGILSGTINNGTGTNITNLTKSGTGLWTLSGTSANTYTGLTSVTGGELDLNKTGALAVSGNLTIGDTTSAAYADLVKLLASDQIASTSAVTINGDGLLNLNGNTNTVASLNMDGGEITGGGNLTVTAAPTFSSTSVAGAGNVIDAGTTVTSIATATVGSGASLAVNGTLSDSSNVTGTSSLLNGSGTTGAVNVASGGTVGGTLTTGLLTVNSGGIVSPGNSPGILTASSAVFNPGGSYILQLNMAGGGTAGTNWDQLAVTGVLDLSSLTPGSFTFDLQTLNGSNMAGPLDSFNPDSNFTLTSIITSTALIGTFNSDLFTIDTSGFQNTYTGTFSIAQDGNNLDLVYTAAVPEPGTWVLLLGGLAMLAFWQRRKKQSLF